jgi:hypothetical protein
LLLAAKCISNGRLASRQLADYVVQQFRREVGDRFVSLILDSHATRAKPADPHNNLVNQWKRTKQVGLQSFEKGRRLEAFARAFFSQFFKVVNANLNTEDGEIDVLLENTNASPFWLEYGSDILVECKNWNANTPLHDVGAFAYKAGRARVRLAFFLSVTGFTVDAVRTMRNQAASSNGPLIVPLTGDEIETALRTQEILEEFLKERIREIKYLQKY